MGAEQQRQRSNFLHELASGRRGAKHTMNLSTGKTPVVASTASFLQRCSNAVPWLVCLTIGVVYGYFSMRITRNIFTSTHYNYYIYLLDALLHGRVNVTPPLTLDLSLYHGKWYLYWGPAPVLLLLPFSLIWGVKASDVLFTMLGGVANVVLIYLCIREMKRYFSISLSLMSEAFLLLSFAFASPNFFLSLGGRIWYTNQIFATTFLLLFYIFFFKYLNTGKLYLIVVSVAFFCLACLTRYTLLFNGLLLTYLFWHSKMTGKKIELQLLISVALTLLFFGCLAAFYNYLKFQNILEVGYRFLHGSRRFAAIIKSGSILSFKYFWYNFFYYFLNPIYFSLSKHVLRVSGEGNSILMAYPSLLLLPVLFFKFKQFDAKKRLFVLTVGVAALITLTFLLLYFATGYVQFGNRYFFDAFPLFFLLLVLVIQYIPKPVQLVLLIWGIVINFWGAYILWKVLTAKG
jgi:hypothetical protein